MYRTQSFRVTKKQSALYQYCTELCRNYKNLYNVTNFYIRQMMTGIKKSKFDRQPNEQQVMDIIAEYLPKYNAIRYDSFLKKKQKIESAGKFFTEEFQEISYPTKENWFMNNYLLDAVFRLSNNIDYRSLPGQTNYLAVTECTQQWKNYFESLKSYAIHPELFTGKPKIPKYLHNAKHTVKLSNQICTIKQAENKQYLRFPKTKAKLWLGNYIKFDEILKQAEIKPIADYFVIYMTMEVPEQKYPEIDKNRIIGIDLGIDYIATITNNCGLPSILVKGDMIKSYNQWYNKENARLKSILTKGHESSKYQQSSKRIQNLWAKRDRFMTDYMHKISKNIVQYCVENQIGTIVIGKNEDWKRNSNMGKKNNQTFVQIPYEKLIWQIQYKAAYRGIAVIDREESYTSKASFLDMDYIPTYGKDDNVQFSGKRKKRGLYLSKNGITIHADINGSGNIIRKEFPDAFDGVTDLSYIRKTQTWNSTKWYIRKAASSRIVTDFVTQAVG